MMTIKTFLKPLAACSLVFFGSAVALSFEDGFEANALEPKDIKYISIDNAIPVMVKDVAVNANGLLTAKKDTGPTPPVPVCKAPPAGTVIHRMTWDKVYTGKQWPFTTSNLQPIGSWTLRTGSGAYKQGKPITGQIITAPFVLDDKPHLIDWVGAQPIPAIGYNPGQNALSVTVAVSPCPGDVYAECKNTARSARLSYGKGVAGACGAFQPGQALWVTWHYLPADLDSTKNTCQPGNASGGVKCDSNFGSR